MKQAIFVILLTSLIGVEQSAKALTQESNQTQPSLLSICNDGTKQKIYTFAIKESWVGAYTASVKKQDAKPSYEFFRIACQGTSLVAAPDERKPTAVLIGENYKIRLFTNEATNAYYLQVDSPLAKVTKIQLVDEGAWVALNKSQYDALLNEIGKFESVSLATQATKFRSLYLYDYRNNKYERVANKPGKIRREDDRVGSIVEALLRDEPKRRIRRPSKPLYRFSVGRVLVYVYADKAYLASQGPTGTDLSKYHMQVYAVIESPKIGEIVATAISQPR